MSKQFSVTSQDLPPARAGAASKGSNQALLKKLKLDFEADRVILYTCECDAMPVDCLCQQVNIVIRFNSDLVVPCDQGIPVVRLTRVSTKAKSANN